MMMMMIKPAHLFLLVGPPACVQEASESLWGTFFFCVEQTNTRRRMGKGEAGVLRHGRGRTRELVVVLKFCRCSIEVDFLSPGIAYWPQLLAARLWRLS